MSSPTAQSGILNCGVPYAKIAQDDERSHGEDLDPTRRVIVVFDSFRVEHRPAEGLVLQGMMSAYEPYVEAGHTVYIVERASGMPIDYSFEDIRDDYASAVDEIAAWNYGDERSGSSTDVPAGRAPAAPAPNGGLAEREAGVDLVGIGIGGLFALAVAANAKGTTGAAADPMAATGAPGTGAAANLTPADAAAANLTPAEQNDYSVSSLPRTPVSRLVLISSAARMSEAARSAMERWQEMAEHLRWREIHRDMVRLSHVGPSAVFYSALAWFFPSLLGTTDYPWDFSITLREAARADVSNALRRVGAPTLIVGGERDRIFTAADMEETARGLPQAELRLLRGGGHAVAKFRTREVERRVLSFLRDGSPEPGGTL